MPITVNEPFTFLLLSGKHVFPLCVHSKFFGPNMCHEVLIEVFVKDSIIMCVPNVWPFTYGMKGKSLNEKKSKEENDQKHTLKRANRRPNRISAL